jgi:thiamine-phosphate pyrophosphorylase
MVVTDRQQAAGTLEEVAAQAFAGGCRWLLLREKDLAAPDRATLTRQLLQVAAMYDARISVSADLDAAALAGGVHLPTGGDVGAARAALGPQALIGVSAHDRPQAEAAARGGADYITLSPVFLTRSKTGYGPPLGLSNLDAIAAALPIPVLALGGVTPVNVRDCREAGAAGVAVMGAVMRADNPVGTTADLVRAVAG